MSTNVTVVGRLGADPEMRFTPAGKSVASFSLVSSKPVKQPDGSWEDTEKTWYRVSAWDSLGESIVESLHKGQQVIVVGRLYMETYKDRDGNERQSLKINAYSVGPDLKRGVYRQVETAGARATSSPVVDPWADDAPPF